MRPPRATLRELGGIVATLAVVLGAAVALLRLADTLPGVLRGEPGGVRRLSSIAEAERLFRARVWTPSYFPDRFRWPPAGVVVHRGPPPAVALTFVDATTGEAALVIAQSLGAHAPVPPELLPPGRTLHGVTVSVDGRDAALRRFIGSDARIWHDLTWNLGERHLALRSRGSVEDLLRMAESMKPRADRLLDRFAGRRRAGGARGERGLTDDESRAPLRVRVRS